MRTKIKHSLLFIATLFLTQSVAFAQESDKFIFRFPRNVIQGDLHAPFVPDREIYAGETFNYPLSISGGSGPYTWMLTGSPLPDGLSYSSSGVISGTPLISSVGTWNGLSFSASDNSGQTVGVGPFTYTVLEPVALSPALNDAYVGEGISFSLSASGGRTPYYYSVASGSLPAGMGLSGGAVSGTPSSAGSYNATIEVEDANGRTAQAPFDVYVMDRLVPSSSLVDGYVGETYSEAINVSGGVSPYSFGLVPGDTIPSGLSLDLSTGAITGTPASPIVGHTFRTIVSDSGHTIQAENVTSTISVYDLPEITHGDHEDMIVGAPYNIPLQATGGKPTLLWSASGALPPGVSLNATGAITGTPTASGVWPSTINVSDYNARSDSKAISLEVYDVLSMTAPSSIEVYTDEAVGDVLSSAGGKAPIAWSVNQLPAGIVMSSLGVLSGTPTTPGTTNSQFTVSDALGQVDNATTAFSIYAPVSVAANPATTDNGIVGAPYSHTFTSTGGKAPISWTTASGTLPTGLSLSSAGVLSGTPSSVGSSSFDVAATDVNGRTDQTSISMDVIAAIAISNAPSADGYIGTPYSFQFAQTGDQSPFTWSRVSGSLPSGMSLSSSGSLSGTPTSSGASSFVVRVAGSGGTTDDRSVSMNVYAMPAITNAPTADPYVGSAYAFQFNRSGGKAPFTWTRRSGTLPAGMSLSSSGSLSGTPTSTGNSSFVVRVTDANGKYDEATVNLTTLAAIAISNAPSADGYIGSSYSFQFARTGGQSPFTWSRVSGSLPSGMSLSASGTLSGTPTSSGASSFVVRVAGSDGTTDDRSVSMNVYAMPAITNAPTSDPYVGSAYSFQFNRSGGKAPFTWSRVSGSLPSGMSLSSSGSLSGTPTAAGNASFVLRVTDANGKFADRSVSLTTLGAVAVANAPSAQGYVGAPYSFQFSPSGGQAPYTWARVSGSLPAGMGLSSSGLLSGTPTSLGTSTFSVRVTDGNGTTATRSVSVNAAEYQVSMSSGSSQISLQSLFTPAQWSSPAQKRVVVPNGVVRGNGSTNAAVIAGSGAWGGNLILQINSGAEIQGRGGSANGGTGGNAIYANRRGNASQRLMIVNNGAIRAGGGGGGKGGVGGKGGGGQSGSSDPEILEPCYNIGYCYGESRGYYWYSNAPEDWHQISWNDTLIGTVSGAGATTLVAGGCTYTKGTMYHWWDMVGNYYGLIRTCMTTTEGGNGGAAGNGGRGQGYNMSRHSGSNGSGGAYGGTNAGRGGTGGNGGTGGTWGSSGATGSKGVTGQNGNRTNGLAGANGSGGGLAGYAIRSSANATYSGSGVKQGR